MIRSANCTKSIVCNPPFHPTEPTRQCRKTPVGAAFPPKKQPLTTNDSTQDSNSSHVSMLWVYPTHFHLPRSLHEHQPSFASS